MAGDSGRLVGGIEAGGTKFVCAVGTGPDDVRTEVRVPTTTPEETLERVVAFFAGQAARTPLAALGVASFGPVDLDERSPTFGFITTTPKPGWRGDDHPAWALQAHYLALGLANLVLTLSPERLVLGGGVMARATLYPQVRAGVSELLAGYLASAALADGLGRYIVPPALGERAGVLGALLLAATAAQ
jgi:predicted NBD/HSP70 family sugar kinase